MNYAYPQNQAAFGRAQGWGGSPVPGGAVMPQNTGWNGWGGNPQPEVPEPTDGFPTVNRVVWRQGPEAAKAVEVMPGEVVMILDSEGDRFYIARADRNGRPLPMKSYSYTEDEPAPETRGDYVTRKEFDELKSALDALRAPQAANAEEGE